MGEAPKKSRDLDGAIAEYRSAVEMIERAKNQEQMRGLPDKTENQWFSRVHEGSGSTLTARGSLDEGIAGLRKAVVADSRNSDLHLELGHLLEKKGDLQSALVEYHQAYTIDQTLYRDDYERLRRELQAGK